MDHCGLLTERISESFVECDVANRKIPKLSKSKIKRYIILLKCSHSPSIPKRVNSPLQMKLMSSDAPHVKRHLTDMIRTLTHLHVKLPAAAAAADTASIEQ